MENQEKRAIAQNAVARAHGLDYQLVTDTLLMFRDLDQSQRRQLRGELTMGTGAVLIVENPDNMTFGELVKLLD
jgi:hypothetical protein